MADFLDEVMDDVKQEQFRKLFEKYGNHLVTLVLVILVSTGLVIWYNNWQLNKTIAAGDSFFQASIDYGRVDVEKSAADLQEIAKNGGGGFPALAKLHEATLLDKQDKLKNAYDLYGEVVSDGGASREMRDMAALRQAYILVRSAKLREELKEDPNKILEELTGADRPWRYSAMELQGFFAFSEKRIDDAKKIFLTLKGDALTPRALRSRAEAFVSRLN